MDLKRQLLFITLGSQQIQFPCSHRSDHQMAFGEDRTTLILINLASIMESADEALLPAVYKEVGAALHATPTGLGSLTLFRSVVQSLCYPLAAYMASRYNRTRVIALGAFLWAAATFLVAISTTFLQVAVSRGLNGIGLALVIPTIQSLVADLTEEESRGSAFGWLQFTGSMGSIIGTFFGLLLASTTVMGIAGWRIAFHLVAAISTIVGSLVWFYAVDPHFATKSVLSKKETTQKSTLEDMREFLKEGMGVLQIPTFQIIVAQGVAGSFGGSGLSFVPMWFELIGFSHEYTGFLIGVFNVATSIGGVFGGKLGDFLARRFPNAGRIVLSQISSASAIPSAAILLLVLPYNPSTGILHAVVIFVTGVLISWNAPATNNPIFSEIVPVKSRTSIYALDNSCESILASFAPPIVGALAEHVYGYKIGDYGRSDDPKTNQENAASLAKALYTSVSISMLLCCSIYSFLYCTYPRDRERARMDSLIASEIEQIDLDSSEQVIRDHTCLQNFESEYDNEMSTIELYHEGGGFENDVSEEKLLGNQL